MSDEPDLLGDGTGFASEEEWIGRLQGEVIGLRAERDRLRGELESERPARRSFMVAATNFGNALRDVRADNARLRAVVQTTLGVALRHMADCHETECQQCVAFGAMYTHLGPPQLDVSGVIGGNAEGAAPKDGPRVEDPKVSPGRHNTDESSPGGATNG